MHRRIVASSREGCQRRARVDEWASESIERMRILTGPEAKPLVAIVGHVDGAAEQPRARRKHQAVFFQIPIARQEHRCQHRFVDEVETHPLTHDYVDLINGKVDVLHAARNHGDDVGAETVRSSNVLGSLRNGLASLNGNHARRACSCAEEGEHSRPAPHIEHGSPLDQAALSEAFDRVPIRIRACGVLEHELVDLQIAIRGEVVVVRRHRDGVARRHATQPRCHHPPWRPVLEIVPPSAQSVGERGRAMARGTLSARGVAAGARHLPRHALNRRQRHGARRIAVARVAGGPAASESLEADLVLSSGFLAMSLHAGFLQAVEDEQVAVRGVMGTSAGALTGSLYSAGYSPEDVLRETTRDPPWKMLRPSWPRFWEGLFALDAVVERLRDLLPPRFEDLDRDFACAVVSASGEYLLIDSGPLPEAVAASAAIPVLFAPVPVPGSLAALGPFKDGGALDRVGLGAWRARAAEGRRRDRGPGAADWLQPETDALVHLIARSSPFSGADDVRSSAEAGVEVVSSAKNGVSLLSLGDVRAQFEGTRRNARASIEGLRERDRRVPRKRRQLS